MTGVEEALGRVPLFAGLSKKSKRSLAGSFKERTFGAGTVVTEEGQDGVGFFVIGDGTATVTRGSAVLATLKGGDYFGEIALIDGGPRIARVTADTDLRCYGITSWTFKAFVHENPDAAWALMQGLVLRIREAEARADL